MAFIPDEANNRKHKELSPNAVKMYDVLCQYRHHEYRVCFLTRPNGVLLENFLEKEWKFPLGSQRNALTELAREGWIRRHATHIELLVGDFSPVDQYHDFKELPPFVGAQKRAGRKTFEEKKNEANFHESGKIEETRELEFHEIVKSFPETVKSFHESGKSFHGTVINFPNSGKIPINNGSPALIPSLNTANKSQTPAVSSQQIRAPDEPTKNSSSSAASPIEAEKIVLTEAEKQMTTDEFRAELCRLYAHKGDVEAMIQECVDWYHEKRKKKPTRLQVKTWLEKEQSIFDAEASTNGKNQTNSNQIAGGKHQRPTERGQKLADTAYVLSFDTLDEDIRRSRGG